MRATRSVRHAVDVPQDLVRQVGSRLQQVAGAEQLGGGAVADAGVDRHHPVQDEQAESGARQLEPGAEVARSDGRLEHRRRHHLARREAHPQVEQVRQVVVGVEQVAVRRRQLPIRAAFAARRPLGRVVG